MKHKLIIALDNLEAKKAKEIVQDILHNNPKYKDQILFKIHDIVSLLGFVGIQELFGDVDCKFMLDLKWHDIPNTLKNYIIQLSKSKLADKIEYITIHASGWTEMLQTVQQVKNNYMPHVKLLGITALTSLEDDDTHYIYDTTAKHAVLKLAKIAIDAWIEWIVCSSHEASVLRWVYGEWFQIVTPWIRFQGEDSGDQKRVKTPKQAIESGASCIVMWRPILEANNRQEVITRFFEEIEGNEYIEKKEYYFEKILYNWDWQEILSYIGAFYIRPEGGSYVRFTSKILSNAYINIWAVERHYSVIQRATSELATKIHNLWIEADLVVWAQMGSVRISLYLAEKLWIDQSIYTQKDSKNNMDLQRHAIDLSGKKIILSEDIVSRGTTIAKMRKVLENLWWKIVAIACVGNRYEQNEQEGIPIISCFIPPKFELYWDEKTPQDQRKDFPHIPQGAHIVENPKNEWEKLFANIYS